MPKRYPRLLIKDMLDCLEAVESYANAIGIENVVNSSLHQDAIIHNLMILGEAANQLPKDIQAYAPEIEWHALISLRNRLVHEYHGIQWDILIPIMHEKVPELKVQLLALREHPNIEKT